MSNDEGDIVLFYVARMLPVVDAQAHNELLTLYVPELDLKCTNVSGGSDWPQEENMGLIILWVAIEDGDSELSLATNWL